MIFHGRLTESESRVRTILDGGTHLWSVTCDPSNMFLHRTFRVTDLNAGGLDEGTIFIHIHNGQKRIVGADGIAQNVFHKKVRRQRKKVLFVKPAKRLIGTGGTNAVL